MPFINFLKSGCFSSWNNLFSKHFRNKMFCNILFVLPGNVPQTTVYIVLHDFTDTNVSSGHFRDSVYLPDVSLIPESVF